MPWFLEVSVIDVGQGDSSLIIATNGAQTRSMLIDGGISSCAGVVHDYVAGRLAGYGGGTLDHIVVTHYDDDHAGGIQQLLKSDNLVDIADVIAEMAVIGYTNAGGRSSAKRVAATAAAAAAAACGGYDRWPRDDSSVAVTAAKRAAEKSYPSKNTDAETAKAGAKIGITTAERADHVNARLIAKPVSVSNAAVAAAIAAKSNGGVRAGTARDVFTSIRGAVPGAVWTGGAYLKTQVIDTGATYEPDKWDQLVGGQVTLWADVASTAPNAARRRLSLARGDRGTELMWHSGGAPVDAPADTPAIFVVAAGGWAWQGASAPRSFTSSQPKNNAAIGLAIRFGNFFYYTADDLPTSGEDLLARAVMANGFANPQGGTFPAPRRVAAFKCGHHGADGLTSDSFLQTLKATATVISCGVNQFGKGDPHPTQNVVERINKRVPRFYLTNCKFRTKGIPGSFGLDQLPLITNQSRICGDNADLNLAVGRHRGDILLFLTQAESVAVPGHAQFHVECFEHDDNPLVHGALVGARTEDLPY